MDEARTIDLEQGHEPDGSLQWMRSIYHQRNGMTEYMGLPWNEAVSAWSEDKLIQAERFAGESRAETLAKLNGAFREKDFGSWAIAYMRFLAGLDAKEREALDAFDATFEDHVAPMVAMGPEPFDAAVRAGRSPLREQQRRVDAALAEFCEFIDAMRERYGFGGFSGELSRDDINSALSKILSARRAEGKPPSREDADAALGAAGAVCSWLDRWKASTFREVLGAAFEMVDRIHDRCADTPDVALPEGVVDGFDPDAPAPR